MPTVFDIANETPIEFDLLSDVYAVQASMSAEERKSPDAQRARLVALLEEKGEREHDLRTPVIKGATRRPASPD